MDEPTTPPKSDAWTAGYALAEEQFLEGGPFYLQNPFAAGTEQHAGFEAGRYDLTQK